ncbi:MAG TPA: hypothetical protein VJ655_17125, partial [Caulobacter sp.]|nr:hypothetical protein [Caulobacter sp.]
MKIRHAAASLAAIVALTVGVGVGAPALASPGPEMLDKIAGDFVRMTLEAGEREPGYVDAYYGPREYLTAAKTAPRPVYLLRREADRLQALLGAVPDKGLTPDQRRRKLFLKGQVRAAQTRLAMIAGDKFSFQDEAQGLFGVRPAI